MRDAAAAIIPMLLFMLIPIWIPIITTTIGALYDALNARRATQPPDTVVRHTEARLAEYTP